MTESDNANDVDGKIRLSGFLKKDGKFSKTATFATAGTFLVLCAYVLSWFAGSTLVIAGVWSVTFPEFDSSAAIALLSILNGTYLANNALKGKARASGG